MRLLERHVSGEMEACSGSRGGGSELDGSSANMLVIRFSLKAIVNLKSSAAGAQYDEKLKRALQGTRFSADLLLLASRDELIGFYTELLAVE
jgi:hypothetical protein